MEQKINYEELVKAKFPDAFSKIFYIGVNEQPYGLDIYRYARIGKFINPFWKIPLGWALTENEAWACAYYNILNSQKTNNEATTTTD